MSEICLKFSISTLTLWNRSGFQLGWWLGGERASGHPSPADPASLMGIGWFRSPGWGQGQSVEVASLAMWSWALHCHPSWHGTTLLAAPRSCPLPSWKHLWAPKQQLAPKSADLENGICLLSFSHPLPAPWGTCSAPSPAPQRTPTVSPLTPLCSSASQAHPANLAEHPWIVGVGAGLYHSQMLLMTWGLAFVQWEEL